MPPTQSCAAQLQYLALLLLLLLMFAARRAEQLEASRGILSREELELQDVQRQMEEQLVEQFMQVKGGKDGSNGVKVC
jgi:hypothetical protein